MNNDKNPTPVFILAPPRSGSTWLQRMLQGHPQICGGEESHFFPLVADWLSIPQLMSEQSNTRAGLLAYISENKQVDIINHAWRIVFSDTYSRNPDAVYHVEKTPSHAFFVKDIVRVLPASCFIVLHRDPRSTAASLMHAGQTWGHYWAPHNIKRAATMWYGYAKAIRDASEEYSNSVLCEVRYEDLVTDTEKTMRSILQSLSLDCNAERLGQVIESGHKPYHGGKEPKEFRRKSPGLEWRIPLSLRDRLVLWRYTRKVASRIGYPSTLLNYIYKPNLRDARNK